jgi:hypothetical protein
MNVSASPVPSLGSGHGYTCWNVFFVPEYVRDEGGLARPSLPQ